MLSHSGQLSLSFNFFTNAAKQMTKEKFIIDD